MSEMTNTTNAPVTSQTVPEAAPIASLRAHYVDTPAGLAFVEDWGGDGIPLYCIHTAGQSGVQYRSPAPRLAALGYRVIVPDLPGHGRTEPHRDGAVVDLGVYAEWSLDLIRRLGLERPVIVGCSIGGKIALDIATRAGDGIRAAFAMAASAEPGHVSVTALMRELEDVAAPARADRTYYGTRAVLGSRVPDARRDMIARMHTREDPQVSTSDLIGWGRHDISDRLRDIAVPTRLVLGADDLWVRRELVERTASAIDGADFEYLDGIGHYPMQEWPEFADELDAWLRARGVVA